LDGRPELYFGLVMLISSTTSASLYVRPGLSPPGWTWVLPWLGMLGYVAFIVMTRWFNEHVMVPRVGYVAFQDQPSRHSIIVGIIVGAALAFLGLVAVMGGKLHELGWMGWGSGILFTVSFVGMGIYHRLPHWVCIGVLAGALTWLYRTEPGFRNWQLASVWTGSAMVLSGAWRLWRFLRANPIPGDAS
jgi:hypothetical protein